MKNAFRTCVMLGFPALLVLLSGMPALLRTGQVDARAWMLPALLLIPAAAFLVLRRGLAHALWAAVGTAATLLLFMAVAVEGMPPVPAVACLCFVALLAMAGGASLAFRQWLGIAFSLAALLLAFLSQERPIAAAPDPRPTLGVITGLPLFWQFDDHGRPMPADAPIITVLRQRFDVRAIDSADAAALKEVDALLLAHPRVMSPAELVAVDAWARAGGRALLLADPMLRWPMPLPLGDRRRPPSISLLNPMIEHWGLRLLPASAGAAEKRRFLSDGRLLASFAASGFKSAGGGCRVQEDGLLARCTLGRGSAVLVADADLIDDRLWLADPAAPLNATGWTADTPQFVSAELGGDTPLSARAWLLSEASLIRAVRVGLIFGIFWAMLGTGLLHWKLGRLIGARSARPSARKRENAT